ncbi:alpha-ribazole phosphatase family protein [Saccharicrinis fermentans]|uniref:Alpha-ribazole phosphatase n=1 Tax=Saccharicrinis fermentans DSM 9555 = JCM 21142 TaxID=869213 RepID=W7YRF8_9BACT|nr:alpha-ribazole phosphatase family protein [Saccharicrinis fermentans]GAF05049.1 alpha-ribazole phosphatase [Saccharicrinis fermentans DSM 9555 = JCM 21142]
MKELYIIRHTTPNIEPGICYGDSDLDVADSFKEEAEKIKNLLINLTPAYIFSSPLIRCRKLGEALFPGSVIHYDNRLKELNFGDWEMKPWKDIDKEVLKIWSDDFVHKSTPNGENFNQLFSRASHFIDNDILPLKEHSKIAMVTHSGIMRCLISRYLHIPMDKIFSLKLNYGAVIKITLHESFEEVDFIK